MKSHSKQHFIVSTHPLALPEANTPLFIAEPFAHHLMLTSGLCDKYPHIEIAQFVRKGPEDLKNDNDFLWNKYHNYLPVLTKSLNRIHGTELSVDFWRRSLSMGLMRHLTMVYDLFKICETYFDHRAHSAHTLAPNSYYTPIDYNEHRWFLQHSSFGQEQLFSMYLSCFYPVSGTEYSDVYQTQYNLNEFHGNLDTDPVVGIMGALFRRSYLDELVQNSGGDVNSIGFKRNHTVTHSLWIEKRQKLSVVQDGHDRFDRFFFFSLPILLPREFVEDFTQIFSQISRQLERYKRLRYVVSEIFIGESYESIALAILNQRGVKIIYNEHNYNEFPYYASILEQQTSFADIFAAHGYYSAPIKHMVATGSLYEFLPDPAQIADKKKQINTLYISSIGTAKYSNYSHGFGETAENAVLYYEFKKKFFKSLSPESLSTMLYRGYPRDINSNNWRLCYDDEALMRPFLGDAQRDDGSVSSKIRMHQSRLVIVDYISTSHLESLSMNIPTIIFIRRESYFLNQLNHDYFDELLASGIGQDDPVKAANFWESIRDNPEEWWSRPEIQAVKDRYLKQNLGKPEYLMDLLLNLVNNDTLQFPCGDTMKTPITEFNPTSDSVYINPRNQKAFEYSDGAAREDRIFNILQSVRDLSIFSDELRNNISDWVSEYHFSQERHNLLRHLHLHPGMSILELGCGCGSITRQLGESGAKVTSVEGSLQRARSAAARCRDLPNVRVHCSNFQDVVFTEKYDVVTFIGVLEYSPQYFESEDPIGECLAIARNALKPDGVLLIAIENQLGLKYFCGLREDHADISYFGIEDRYNASTAITFGKRELTGILNGLGFGTVEFHYPFPDYKIPKAVFTDNAFSTKEFHPEEIIRQMQSRDYAGEITPSFNERLAVPVLCRNGLMADLSNSFLVLASPSATSVETIRNPDLLAAVYTTERNNAYNVQTDFLLNGSSITASKKRLVPGPVLVSSRDILSHQPGDEGYISGLNLEAEFRRCITCRDFETMSRLLTLLVEFLVLEAVESPCQDDPMRGLIHPDFFDCVPSNLILADGRLHYIDREWKLRSPMSLGALMLRNVDALQALDPDLSELSRGSLIESLQMAGCNLSHDAIVEYNQLISHVTAQVYQGSYLSEAAPLADTAEQVHHPVTGNAMEDRNAPNPLEKFKQFDYGNEFRNFICPNPFLYAELRQDGEVSCCCYLPFTLGNFQDQGMEEMWNSKISQELRRSILRGEFSYCDKTRCAAMQEALLPARKGSFHYQTPYQLLKKDRINNPILRTSIDHGRTVVESGPRIVSFEDDPSCNLRCPSCRTAPIVLSAEESQRVLKMETELLDAMGPETSELWFSGSGDPFASGSYKDLFLNYDFTKMPHVKFRIDTNGLLLTKEVWTNLLKKIRSSINLIAVSVDAVNELTYKSIRQGGNFQTLMDNLRYIASLPERKQGMRFILRMIVQKKNYHEMKDFIELGRSLGVDSVVFSVIQNWGTFPEAEYRRQAVHLSDHPEHPELLRVLQDPAFSESLVDLGNLTQLYHDHTSGFEKANTVPETGRAEVLAGNTPVHPRARVIAFYLPQFHTIPENDRWWGKGFTEWTNTAKAKPLFSGHYQPHLSADLGYYDLRVPEARIAQAELAQHYGIEAFCYWHYWFAGHQLLETPFQEVVRTGKPDFPFCLGWANQTWSGIWHGAPNRILIEQTYPGLEDYKAHFNKMLPAFRDHRYMRINDKPLFLIYAPQNLPDAKLFTSYWQELAHKSGLNEFHFVAHGVLNPQDYGCQSCVDNAPFVTMEVPTLEVRPIEDGKLPRINHYSELVRHLKQLRLADNEHPLVVPNWDNTPRSGANGLVLYGSTPDLFFEMMQDAVQKAQLNPDPENRIIFVKAWNEWAEGNHLEPDLLYGHGYLQAVYDSIFPVR